MEGSSQSYRIITISLLAIIFLSLNLVFKGLNSNRVHLNEELVYDMPRPKSYVSLFDLSARQIVRIFKNLLGSDAHKATPSLTQVAPNRLKNQNQKNNLKAQKNDPHSAASALRASKPRVEISSTDTSRKSTMSSSKSSRSARSYDFAPIPVDIAPGYIPENPDQAKAEEKRKDIAEAITYWTNLLLSQPTKANVQKLLIAFREGAIDEDGYFTVASRMLEEKKSETQVLGVFAISILPNPDSRNFIALSKAYPNLQKEGQMAIDAFLPNYAQAKQLRYLVVPFQSRYPYIVLKAGEILEMAIAALKNSPNDFRSPADNRKGSSLSSKDLLGLFVSVLAPLEKSSNREIQEMAVRLQGEIRELIK